MVRIVLIAAALAALAPPAIAQQDTPITGAFGLQFGARFEPQPGSTGERTARGDRFTVVPPEPFRSFNTYTVTIAPKTMRIWAISGSRGMESVQACHDELAFIEGKLDAKYGGGVREEPYTALRRVLVYRKYWEPQIVLACDLRALSVTYMDPELRDAARDEVAELLDQADDKGL